MTQTFEDAAAIASRFINNTGRNIFLTGKAGTGKTTFLRSIVAQTYKNAIVAAPTGIAAINAGGVTLHSLFQLPFGTFIPTNHLPDSGTISIQLNTPDSLLRGLQMHVTKRKLIREMELLIIDEVSMLRADLLDAIDVTLRAVRRNRAQPFGGVQVLFIGDLFQLPPVVRQDEWEYLKPHYPEIYFFAARALRNQQPVYIELDKIYRQTDNRFITLLTHFRDHKVSREDIDELNNHYIPDFQSQDNGGYIHLTTHNRKADSINRDALADLPGEVFSYQAGVDGDFNEYLYPVEARLDLKEGAQVMFIKNDYSGEQRYFNGKIGTVSSLSAEAIGVIFGDGGKEILVDRYVWENKKYNLDTDTNQIEENVAGTFSQYPIKLAWAITVHKSQGLTFEKAIIDVSSAFAPGQVYVALSRLVSLEGLVLSARIPYSGPGLEEGLVRFVQEKEKEPPPETLLPLEIQNFIRESVLKSFNFSHLLHLLHTFSESHDKDEKRSVKQQQKGWALKLEEDFKPVKETADKFMDQLKRLLRSTDENYLLVLNDRVGAARGYFEPLIRDFSERILKQIRVIGLQRNTKTYLSDLKELERLFFRQLQTIYKSEELIRSAISGREFSREALMNSPLYQDRVKVVEQQSDSSIPKKEKKEKRTRKEKKDKKEVQEKSDQITYHMFMEGKSMAEIAASRSLAATTIEGHLTKYIALAQLDIFRLVDPEKVSRVLELIRDMDTLAIGRLKESVGEDVTYGELRMILAHKLSKQDG